MPPDILSQERLDLLITARLFAYSLLKRAFGESPSKEFLEVLMTQNLLNAFPFAEQNSQIRQGVELTSNYLKGPDVLSETSLMDLRSEYTRLFVGPGKMAAPPWESTYRGEGGSLFQSVTLEVRKEYQKFGLAVNRLNVDPDDYIGLELEFMHHLTERAIKALSKGDDPEKIFIGQRDFLANHLLKWAPSFCEDVYTHAQTNFYRGMAKLMAGFLEMDHSVLDELLRRSTPRRITSGG